MSLIMHDLIFEKLAVRETGRAKSETSIRMPFRCVFFPNHSSLKELIVDEAKGGGICKVINYGSEDSGMISKAGEFIRRLVYVIGLAGKQVEVDIYLFSRKYDYLLALMILITCRLLSIKSCLYDFRFRANKGIESRDYLTRSSEQIVYGDATGMNEPYPDNKSISFRGEFDDCTDYLKLRKEKAAPHVLVYGDYEDRKLISLIDRTCNLVKQKYPRTEFLLLLGGLPGDYIFPSGLNNHAIHIRETSSEDEVREVFGVGDILVLLSEGGLNRFFVKRARAAGFPIITNSLNYPKSGISSKIINITENSYSVLTNEIIMLADNEEHYRSFQSGQTNNG